VGEVEWEATGWAFASVGQAVTWRQLSMMAAPDGPGTVALRADAQVIWDPMRAPTSLISKTAVDSITVSQLPGSGGAVNSGTTSVHRVVTMSDVSVVDHYVSVVNALPVDDVTTESCPLWTGLSFRVDFQGSGGVNVATVSGDEAQCGGFSFTVDGTQQAALSDPNRQLLGLVSATLGVPLASTVAPSG
jgi:hypothetical protein